MKHEKSRETLQSAALSRARMFIKADLGWLPGFPLAQKDHVIEWIIAPREDGHAVERKSLSREHLQKAAYSYNRLVRHFPRALPRAVENIRAWKRGVPLLFDVLKPGLQANEPFLQSVLAVEGVYTASAVQMGSDMRNRHPFLGRFIDALGYILFLTPEDLSPALRWTSLHASEIRTFQSAFPGDDGLLSLVSLWELSRRLGYRDAEFMLPLIGDKRAPACPTHGWMAHLNGLRKAIVESTSNFFRSPLPTVPRPVLVDELLKLITWALQQNQDVRRRAFELMKIVLDFDVLTPWEAAWRKLEQTPSARQHILRGLSPASVQTEIGSVEARIKALLRDHPPEIHIAILLNDIRMCSSPSRTSEFTAVCRALRALPPIHRGAFARGAFLHDWADTDKTSSPLFAVALRRFAQYISAGRGSTARLKPWENVLKTWTEGPGWSWSILEDILRDQRKPAVIETCFQTLEKAGTANPAGVDYEEACRLIALVKVLKDRDLALTYAGNMAKERVEGSHFEENLIRTAHILGSGSQEFGRLFKALDKMELRSIELEAILQLDRDLQAKGWAGMIREAVLSGEGPPILAIAARRGALLSLGGTCDPPESGRQDDAPGWISQYPPEFAGTLAALARFGLNAERTARRAFGQDYIPPEALRAEIAVLEVKIPVSPESQGQSKRLANLRLRLASAFSLAPGRSLLLKKRLDRRVRRDVFREWNLRLDDELLSSLVKTVGVTSIPPKLVAPSFWPVLTSLMGLAKPFREIGLELVRRRCGSPPWKLDDHPVNQAFLEKIRKEGIDPAPWIQQGTAQAVDGENGRRLRVAFEDDPLEIFQMGAAFQTCLKPGGVNFYSVISNAADINKRVLFARDEDGKIAGRCLFALSNQGGILTFHPYCHDKGLDFPRIVSRFAEDLASRMKTAVVARGQVERLVAPKWYDDGPRDTGFRFPYLEPKSAFRSRLETMKPEDVLESAIKAVGPLSLNALTLPPIVMLPELEDRPELVVPLLAPLERCEDIPVEVWTRTADLARQAERLEQARRIFHKSIIPSLSRQMKNGNLDDKAMELGLELDPSATLRLFRRTRPPRVKSDEQEPSDRRKFIARAHEALGRKSLALRLQKDIK